MLGPSWAAGITAGPNLAIDPSVGISPVLPPPSKNAILVCRQLYIEMSNMQAATFRQYWSENSFDISDDHGLASNVFCPGPDRDLQHVKRFADHLVFDHLTITVRLHFQAGKWIASFYPPDHPFWSKIFQSRGKPIP